ncbi:MAG: AAA family ATPase [Methylococcaceae bacterium]
MLNSLKIKNFRCLEDLTFNHLARVNLLVGRNNVGKSTVLEALRIYATYGDPREIEKILNEHDETLDVVKNGEDEINLPVQHLFTNHQIGETKNSEIYIGNIEKTEFTEMKRTYYSFEKFPDKELKRLNKLLGMPTSASAMRRKELGTEMPKLSADSNAAKQALKVNCKSELLKNHSRLEKKGILEFWFDFEDYDKNEYEGHSRLQKEGLFLPFSYIPTSFLSIDTIAEIWDSILLTESQKQVVEALNIIKSGVEGIGFVKRKDTTKSSSERCVIIKMENEDKPFPLKSLGDGMTRILQLILSLIKARNGFLLIDEFENGLHYSVHAKVWQLVFQLAEKLNVQVFATTHSWDCVKGFGAVWEKEGNQNKGSFHRLFLNPNKNKVDVMPYDCETLDSAIEENIEVR